MVSASLLLEEGKEEWNLVTLIPYREGGWASCQDLCPPIQDKARSVVMAISTPLLEGTKQGTLALSLHLFFKGKEDWVHGHPHSTSRRKVGKWPRPLPFYSREGERCGHGHSLHSSRRKNGMRPWSLPLST